MDTTYTFWITRQSATGPEVSGPVEASRTADGWRLDINPRHDDAADTFTIERTVTIAHGSHSAAALDELVAFLARQ